MQKIHIKKKTIFDDSYQDVYENIDEYNSGKRRKVLISINQYQNINQYYVLIADMMRNLTNGN